MRSKDLLGLRELSAEEIGEILTCGLTMKETLRRGEEKKTLQGKSVVTLFYENSTRTRTSFELAAQRLGAYTIHIAASSSSVQKGETLVDTGKTLDAMKHGFIVMRHPMGGALVLLAKTVKAHVVNAGDGMNEHPTQALLDMLTMLEQWGTFEGKTVAILGDLSHSRVAKSNLYGLQKMGASVRVYAPRTLTPTVFTRMGAKVCSSREEAVEGADAVMGLRIQLERQKAGNFPSLGEYAKYYGVNEALLSRAKKGALVLHPGPVNRGVELTSGVIDGETSFITDQVFSGVAVRMAVLTLLSEVSA